MKITITIDDRTGNAIKDFCKANNVKQNDYLTGIIEKQFNIDRFGDLNDLLVKKNISQKPKMELVKSEIHTEERNDTVELTNNIQTTSQKGKKISRRIIETK